MADPARLHGPLHQIRETRMAGSFAHFGSGTIEREGLKWGVHYWPIAGFKLHFTDEHEFRNIEPSNQEDLKACIYAWGGPKPSFISRTKLDFDKEKMMFMILYLEKHLDGLQQERSNNQPSEVVARSDGDIQG